MKMLEKVWGSLGLFETMEGGEEEEQQQQQPRSRQEEPVELKSRRSSGNNLVNLPSGAQKQMRVMVVEPFSFDDAQNIADHLRNRKPVVVNLENTEKEVAKRLIDFISGTTYAVSGSIQKIGNNIFLCAPNNVDVAYSPREEGPEKPFMPWNTK